MQKQQELFVQQKLNQQLRQVVGKQPQQMTIVFRSHQPLAGDETTTVVSASKNGGSANVDTKVQAQSHRATRSGRHESRYTSGNVFLQCSYFYVFLI